MEIEEHAHTNNWLPIDEDLVNGNGSITIENAQDFDGVVLDSNGFVDSGTLTLIILSVLQRLIFSLVAMVMRLSIHIGQRTD